jgi:hypothetical protein
LAPILDASPTLELNSIICDGSQEISMQIEIPTYAEPLLRERASAAGFDSIEAYAVRRILFDDQELAEMDAAAVDPQTVLRFEEGMRSGSVEPWTVSDLAPIRERIQMLECKGKTS